jgi:quercetin dioxygenase-like cupin family protein
MTKPLPFVVTPGAYARALNAVGEKITVLAPHAATQGYEIFLQQGDEGTGPPPHSHDWDESFYVVKGEVEISYDGSSVAATAGTLVHLPAGTVHAFRFGPGGGQMISVTGQGSQATRLFTSIDEEIPAGPPDIPKLIEVVQRFGVTMAG